MAKLNKQEINAIASKLHRELEKAAKESRENAIRNYTPSESYLKVANLLLDRDEFNRQISIIENNKREVINDARDILCESYGIRYFSEATPVKEICNRLVELECKLKEVPEFDALKEEVTIAAIDDSFDTSKFIEEQLAKYK